MQRMWRQLFAALVGVLAVAASASAQAPGQIPIPQPLPNGQARLYSLVTPAQYAAAPVSPAGGQVYVRGSGGCSTGAPCQLAQPCNNGCGSFKSDCNFMFGSCKSFFDPCGPSGNGHGFGGHGRCGGGLFGGHGDRCGTWTFGSPYSHGCNPCVYDSWLNH
jgi:hypothetical protein